jgi:hypothetical protein
MGIGSSAINLLLLLKQAGLIDRPLAVVEIGAQQLNNSFLLDAAGLSKLGAAFGVDIPPQLPSAQPTWTLQGGQEHLAETAPPASLFWRWLGFEYASIDIDGSPGSIPLDLNYDSIPAESRGRYPIVTNFGTTEHVANQLNAFKIIHDLAAPGGLMIHEVPTQGMFNHGLVNYNFKFFFMLGRSNGYRIIDAAFSVGAEKYGLPDNLAEFLRSQSLQANMQWDGYEARDAGIRIVMQKSYDIPFVAPIDVPTGASTDHEELRRRYWTVYAPARFESLPRHDAAK